jgi:hypothetical protein
MTLLDKHILGMRNLRNSTFLLFFFNTTRAKRLNPLRLELSARCILQKPGI